MRLNNIQIEKIIELHKLGWLDKQIGENLGVCSDDIYYHRKKIGLKANGPTKGSLVVNELGERQCTKCLNFLSVENFEKQGKYIRRMCISCKRTYAKQNYTQIRNSIQKNILYRIKCWKNRAIKNNIEFNLDYDYVISILNLQQFKCFYSDQDMLFSGTTTNHHYSLSCDRVIPELGYIKGNIVFCIHKINLIKNNMTLEEMRSWTPIFYEKIEKATFLTAVKPFLIRI